MRLLYTSSAKNVLLLLIIIVYYPPIFLSSFLFANLTILTPYVPINSSTHSVNVPKLYSVASSILLTILPPHIYEILSISLLLTQRNAFIPNDANIELASSSKPY